MRSNIIHILILLATVVMLSLSLSKLEKKREPYCVDISGGFAKPCGPCGCDGYSGNGGL